MHAERRGERVEVGPSHLGVVCVLFVADHALVAALALRRVKGAVSRIDQQITGRPDRAADRDRHLKLGAGRDDRRVREQAAQLLGHCTQRSLVDQLGTGDGELLAADPADEADLADRGNDPERSLAQHLVTRHVAVAVVDRLEVVEVEHQEAARRVLGQRAQVLPEAPAILQQREVVGDRELAE